jgi:hypothetical protein
MNRLIILKRFARGALLVGILGSSFLSHAQEMIGRWTAAEVASLPQYCQDRLIEKRNAERWRRELGPEIWEHLHHYCYALIFYSRASTEIDARKRRDAAKQGIANFNYVLKRWPPTFPLYQQAQMYNKQLQFILKLR